MDKSLSGGEVRTNVQDLFSAGSEFYVENVQRYVREASSGRVVISLSGQEIKRLRDAYRRWKTKAELKGSAKIRDGKVAVAVREINGMPVTLQSYRMEILTERTSWLVKDWQWRDAEGFSGIFTVPMPVKSGMTYWFDIGLPETSSSMADWFKSKKVDVRLTIEGVDDMGRKVTAEF
jgi:hypothetical protein